MASYRNFLFFDKEQEPAFAELRRAVDTFAQKQGRLVSVMADDHRLRLQFEPEVYAFYFAICAEPWVREESDDLARSMQRHPQAAQLAGKTWRVEFYGDDDTGMDFFNDFFALMESISTLPGCVVYDYVNGQFFGET
ncbi:MAG: hypothetical protein U1F40_02025 [Turneriella sp.]